MLAQEQLLAGDFDAALETAKQGVRTKPEDPEGRRLLFYLYCLTGDWERGLNQLEVLAGLSKEAAAEKHLLQALIKCELARSQVFSGKSRPAVYGEPADWIAMLIASGEKLAAEKFPEARELRRNAMESAPWIPGTLNEVSFEWLADADPRLGPMLEVMMEGSYWWIPFSRTKRISMAAPGSLRDLLWAPADFVWSNNVEAVGFIPVRYPGTEKCEDGQLRLAQKTEWQETVPGFPAGKGQRMFCTNLPDQEFPLLEVRKVEFETSGICPNP